MPEPITLTLVGTVVLTEGIKFLYSQAGELIKRWREQNNDKSAQAAASTEIQKELPPIFEGTLAPLKEDLDRLGALQGELIKLRRDISNYVDGTELVDASDNTLVTQVDTLRQALEAIYAQRITFKGEQREPSGTPLVMGEADIKRIVGLAGGVVAGTISAGKVIGKLTSEEVAESGVGAGVHAGHIRSGS